MGYIMNKEGLILTGQIENKFVKKKKHTTYLECFSKWIREQQKILSATKNKKLWRVIIVNVLMVHCTQKNNIHRTVSRRNV